MPRRDELTLFSTAFIDLMACSLAGACILWVLTLEARPAAEEPPPRQSVFVRIAQAGLSHFEEGAIALTGPELGATWKLSDFQGQPPRQTPRGATVTLGFERPTSKKNAEFGGWLTLMIEDLKEELKLSLAFGSCSVLNDLHFIQVDSATRDGFDSKLAFVTRPECLQASILGQSGVRTCAAFPVKQRRLSLDDFRHRLRALRAERPVPLWVLDTGAANKTWQIVIHRDGRAEVLKPPSHADEDRFLAQLGAGP